MFGKPGHGAPTENIKKKKFTEYQLDKEMNGYAYGDPEYDPSTKYDPGVYGRGATEYSRGAPEPASARPPPDYRSTTDAPRPQTYDAYERGRPSPNGMDHNPVSTFITVILAYTVVLSIDLFDILN